MVYRKALEVWKCAVKPVHSSPFTLHPSPFTLHPWIAAFSLLALVSGCTVGPDFHRPKAPAAAGYTAKPLTATASSPNVPGGEEQRFVKDMDIPQQWWTLFESPPLNALIEKSIKANPTLDAAKAALRQARELAAAQKGFYFPTVQANASASRQKNATETDRAHAHFRRSVLLALYRSVNRQLYA